MRAQDLEDTLRRAWGESTRVVARRPGKVYELDVPAYLSDGDAASVFALPLPDGQIRLTDLGHTASRIGYTRNLTARIEDLLARLAERNGFNLVDWEIRADVPPAELLAGAMGLVQIQSSAEAAISTGLRAAVSAERFREIVRETIREAFPAAQVGFSDPHGEYSIDAVIEGPRAVVGIAAVPSDIEAERAVAAKLKLDPYLQKELGPDRARRWIALPRDINALSAPSRTRLMREYLAPIPVFEAGRSLVGEKVLELAA